MQTNPTGQVDFNFGLSKIAIDTPRQIIPNCTSGESTDQRLWPTYLLQVKTRFRSHWIQLRTLSPNTIGENTAGTDIL